MAKDTIPKRTWSMPPLIKNPTIRWIVIIAIIAYAIMAFFTIKGGINPVRIKQGWPRTVRLITNFVQPDFFTRIKDIRIGVLESITMTVVSTFVGVILAIPFSLGAARNIAPRPVYLFSRTFIILSRTFPEIVVALLFVVMVGFGPLAGAITLMLATIGFIAKLMAEDIEDIDESQVEAIKATGASWPQMVVYSIIPQVLPRFIGLTAYRLDINFRQSAILGIVGAGGIGAVLKTSMSRYDFDTTGAILAIIIAIVLVLELISGYIRKRVQ